MEQILARAREQEQEYDWLRAAESYSNVLNLASEQDFSRKAEFYERSGFALYRAAMQADSVDEFKARINHAIGNYEGAREFLGKLSGLGSTARTLRCRAMVSYLGFWLTAEVPEKKRLLDESWKLTMEALKAFKEIGGALEYGMTYNQLSMGAGLGAELEWKPQDRNRIVREAVLHGKQAIEFLSSLRGREGVAETCVKIAGFLAWTGYMSEIEKRDEYFHNSLDYWSRGSELDEKTALLELANWPAHLIMLIKGSGNEESLANWKNSLEFGRKTKDRFVIGRALDELAHQTFWRARGAQDPENLQLYDEAVRYIEEARQNYLALSFISPRGGTLWAEEPYSQYYWALAEQQADLQRRRDLSDKALQAARNLPVLAKNSGFPGIVVYGYHVFSKVLEVSARLESDPNQKREFLEEALRYRKESIKVDGQFDPFSFYDLGVSYNHLSNILVDMSAIAETAERRRELLAEAIIDKERGLKLCLKQNEALEKLGQPAFSVGLYQFAAIGNYQYEYGELLARLYGITQDNDYAKKAAQAFEEAAESFQKPNLASRTAECFWKAAQAFDSIEHSLKASENFDLASKYYIQAAQNIPQLKGLYQEYSIYMEAWSNIQKAKHHHARQDYASAVEFYEKAASLHRSTRKWAYLAYNYAAWAQTEKGEHLSNKELSRESIQAFQQAARLFPEGKRSLQGELSRVQNTDEKKMIAILVRAADLRQEYCNARIALEEAKILDRKGDQYSSSEKYGQAAEIFEKIGGGLESDQSRQELKLIVTLSKAWQTMTKAEASDSPELYLEASLLFEEAKGLSPTERTTMLSSGHSRFCKALEAGTRFADTREPKLHATAIQHLESAANYYLKAGLQNASEYAKASRLLFDAYLFMDEASREKDSEKKAKFYLMAEKVLQASADSYTKAQYPGKREQVQGLLEKVKGERELALSLTEILHAPAFVSTTSTFATPTPTYEKAVGLERFEHADVQASMITRQRSLRVGEDLALEIELVNAGRGPAQLIKVEELIPEGFELSGKPEPYRVEDSYLNMKGKRLDPLKTEEVKLVLRPKVQGQFTLKPRILYLDESGRYKSHEPESIEVTVKELGISGWLKGR